MSAECHEWLPGSIRSPMKRLSQKLRSRRRNRPRLRTAVMPRANSGLFECERVKKKTSPNKPQPQARTSSKPSTQRPSMTNSGRAEPPLFLGGGSSLFRGDTGPLDDGTPLVFSIGGVSGEGAENPVEECGEGGMCSSG